MSPSPKSSGRSSGKAAGKPVEKSSGTSEALEDLLDYLKRTRGFDFGGYKRPSLQRRMIKRMQYLGVKTYTDYKDYLEVHPEEFTPLFNTILINVTSFFRDPLTWEYLQTTVLPQLLADNPGNSPLRVWSAGCASGQETYSLAIVLAEALGEEAFRRRVKIYATDMDQEALTEARLASYSLKDLQSVPEPLRKKYFEANGVNQRFVFRNDLRRYIIFGRHDLTQDAPISRLALIVCRNVLMYFNSETQAKIVGRLHFALEETGYLFLGRAEMLMAHGNLFTPVELRYRIFTKANLSAGNLRERLLIFTPQGNHEMNDGLGRVVRLREALFDASPTAELVVDYRGKLALINARARQLFNLTENDLGRPFQDLEVSYRPVDLRTPIEQAYTERKPINLSNVERVLANGEKQHLDVQVVPLQDGGGPWLGVCLSFNDVTQGYRMQDELLRAHEDVETSYEELQSTNEEMETTNEELQSTVEELETTNEELQSSNEEMETMNEELQSTNEELQTLNDELRLRTQEVHSTNAFLSSVLGSLHSGVVALNRDFNIISWNQRSEDLWGLRKEEVLGKSFFSLDSGLPVDQLRSALRACLDSGVDRKDLTVEAINRRGKTFQCQISCAPLLDGNQRCEGVILLMDEGG